MKLTINMPKKGKFRTKFKRGDKTFYAIRSPDGAFADIQSLDRTVVMDRRKKAKKKVKSGQGFRGDIKR